MRRSENECAAARHFALLKRDVRSPPAAARPATLNSVNDIFSLAGKTALVAGASRGIGLAIAQGLAHAGARTILAARSLDKLEEHTAALQAKGHSAAALRMDMSDSASIDAALE